MAHCRLLRFNKPGITQHRSSISTIPTITTAVRRCWWASHRIDAEAPQPPLGQAFRRPSGSEETCGSPCCVLGQLTVRISAQSVVYPGDRSTCRFRQGAGERVPSRPSARVPVPKRPFTASISSPGGGLFEYSRQDGNSSVGGEVCAENAGAHALHPVHELRHQGRAGRDHQGSGFAGGHGQAHVRGDAVLGFGPVRGGAGEHHEAPGDLAFLPESAEARWANSAIAAPTISGS